MKSFCPDSISGFPCTLMKNTSVPDPSERFLLIAESAVSPHTKTSFQGQILAMTGWCKNGRPHSRLQCGATPKGQPHFRVPWGLVEVLGESPLHPCPVFFCSIPQVLILAVHHANNLLCSSPKSLLPLGPVESYPHGRGF